MRDIHTVLQEIFGFSAFRPYQEPLIRAVLNGRSALGILPTAAGKSLCYQLPAVVLPPVTLVISPLIALMQDQVRQLTARGIAAVVWHHQLTATEALTVRQQLIQHTPRLVYVAPERLWHPDFQAWLKTTTVSLLVVDEAHCLSEWGFDFRPDYRQIPPVLAQLAYPPVLALTATALPAVREDIQRTLGIETVIQAPLDRPNLTLALHSAPSALAQQQQIHQILDRLGPTDRVLIYADSRKDTERWAEHLRLTRGMPVAPYHAGLPGDVRQRTQEAFTAGTTPVLVATTAFGMGVDIPSIRAVLHVGLPQSPADYYQQIGRSGRDGAPALAHLSVQRARTQRIREHLLRQAAPSPHLDTLWASGIGLETGRLWLLPDDPALRWPLTILIAYLTEHGLAERVPSGSGDVPALRVQVPMTEAGGVTMRETLTRRYALRQAQFTAMLALLDNPGCRRTALHQYFGADPPRPVPLCCDHCTPDAFVPVPDTVGQRPTLSPLRGATRPAIAVVQEWRQVTATERGVAPFQVLADSTLAALLTHPPRSRADLAQLPGMTADQVQRYGAAIVDLMAPYPDPEPAADSASASAGAVATRSGRTQVIWIEGAPQAYPWAERTITWTPTTLTVTELDRTFAYDRLTHSPTRLEALRFQPSAKVIITWEAP